MSAIQLQRRFAASRNVYTNTARARVQCGSIGRSLVTPVTFVGSDTRSDVQEARARVQELTAVLASKIKEAAVEAGPRRVQRERFLLASYIKEAAVQHARDSVDS